MLTMLHSIRYVMLKRGCKNILSNIINFYYIYMLEYKSNKHLTKKYKIVCNLHIDTLDKNNYDNISYKKFR